MQLRWKKFVEHPNVQDLGIQIVMGKPCRVFKHDKTDLFLSFHRDSRKSFTGYALSRQQSIKHDKTGIIGKNYNK
jgi:RIO-like serine/threonine protein kinase